MNFWMPDELRGSTFLSDKVPAMEKTHIVGGMTTEQEEGEKRFYNIYLKRERDTVASRPSNRAIDEASLTSADCMKGIFITLLSDKRNR